MCCADENEDKEIVSQIVIDKEYREAYSYLGPTTVIINGTPHIISVPHYVPEYYGLKILVTYIDETTSTKTISVTKEIYDRTVIGEEWKG